MATALVALVLTAFFPAPGAAQQESDGPLRLVPSQPAGEVEQVDSDETEGRTGQRVVETTPRRDQTSVAVVELATVDPSSVGLLTPENGGFPLGLWTGSRRETIERLIPLIPDATPSRTAQSLRRRLLMTAAHVPRGTPVAPSFLGLRVERLAASGAYTDALALAALASPQIDDPVLQIVAVDSALLSGDHGRACAVVEAALQAGRRSPYWVRALTFCRLLSGDAERARLTAAILRELPGESDQPFDQLVAILAGDTDAPLDQLNDPTPLHLAMIRAARRAMPDQAAESARPAILRAIASSPNASIEARLIAAEAAERAGVLPADALAQVYASLAFSEEQHTNALTEAADLPRPRANALLFQTAASESIPTAQAEALATALRLADAAGHGTLARVNAGRLAALVPDADLMWFAKDAGLALLHAQNSSAARGWFDLARLSVSEAQPEPAVAVLTLLPSLFMAPAPDAVPWVPDMMIEWWRGVAAMEGGAASAFGGSALSLLDAVGMEAPEQAWAGYIEISKPSQAQRPSMAILRGLQHAGEEARVGEAIVFALVALGNAHPADVDLATITSVVATLGRVGLHEDARGLALEALVGRSLQQ